MLLILLPLQSLLYCYKTGLDWTHVDKTDQLPSLPRNLQNHNCPLSGILKAHTQTHKYKWVERFLFNLILPWLCLLLLLCYLFLCQVATLPVAERCDSNHFLDSSNIQLSLFHSQTPTVQVFWRLPLTHIPSWAVYSSAETALKLPQRPQVRLAWCLVSVKAMLAALSMVTVKPNSSLQSL